MTNPLFPDLDTLGNMKPISKVVFSLGSNTGDRLETLQGAVNWLAETPDLMMVDISSVYRTTPVGPVADQPDFYNLVLVAESVLEPLTLLERAQAIEAAFGRPMPRTEPAGGPRTLDIDLVMVGKRNSHSDRLQLPHPRVAERAFVLVPWLEADPKGTLDGRPLAELVAELDVSGVQRIDERVDLP